MGAPSISIAFIEKAQQTIQRGERGILAMILRDTGAAAGPYTIITSSDIPAGLSDASVAQVKNALLGYETTPRKVILYVIANVDGYTAALNYLCTQRWNWLVCPTAETDEKTADLVAWIKTQRNDEHLTYKAILPNTAADFEGVVNVANGYSVGSTAYTAEQACARVGGIICGTSSHRSSTYAALNEATDCDRLSRSALDTAVDAGKLVFMWDGEKVKICRGVTSFQTKTMTKGDSFKKIRLVEIMDMIRDDITITAEDTFIGKYPNTYDAKCVLISAINGYFHQLEKEYVLAAGFAEIDIEKNIEYIKEHGGVILVGDQEIPIEDATEQQIKEAPTGSYVFLRAVVRLVDAIEDIVLDIYIG
jgi:hypothetical protein